MKKYSHILFDLDDTLLCHAQPLENAFTESAKVLQLPYDEQTKRCFLSCDADVWNASRLWDTASYYISSYYHELYRRFTYDRIALFRTRSGLEFDTEQMAEEYLHQFGMQRMPVAHCADTLSLLSAQYSLIIATNGLSDVQCARAADIAKYFCGVTVSEEIGFIKPDSRFFDAVTARYNISPENCLMVGDSYTNDICGAKLSGIDACWYNPDENGCGEIAPDFTIKDISQLCGILL